MRSSCETFNHLRKVLGTQNSSHHHININPAEYLSNKFVIAFDFEKMAQDGRSFSGYSTRQGEHLTLMMK